MDEENILEIIETLEFSDDIEIVKKEECFSFEYYTTIPDFYDRVRGALNVPVTTINNDMIDYPENAPMAEMRIKSRVPIWRELTGIKKALFETCIIYMTCYQLCPIASAKNITEQTTPSLTIKFSTNDNGKSCERFLGLIDDFIAQILEEKLQWSFGFEVTKPSSPCGCKKVYLDMWNKDNKNAFNPLGSE